MDFGAIPYDGGYVQGSQGVGTPANLLLNPLAGNVGIGIASPTALFQVAESTTGPGTVSVSGSTVTGAHTQFTNTFNVGDTITVITSSGTEPRAISSITSNTVLVTTVAFTGTAPAGTSYSLAGGTRFAVKGNGSVGIGTTNPSYSLDVAGQIHSATGYVFPDGTTQTTAYSGNAGAVTSITAGAGLSGGTITGSGTISLPSVGTSGTYGTATAIPVLTTDAYGRITGVTNTPNNGTVIFLVFAD